jgi:hypothetical protein
MLHYADQIKLQYVKEEPDLLLYALFGGKQYGGLRLERPDQVNLRHPKALVQLHLAPSRLPPEAAHHAYGVEEVSVRDGQAELLKVPASLGDAVQRHHERAQVGEKDLGVGLIRVPDADLADGGGGGGDAARDQVGDGDGAGIRVWRDRGQGIDVGQENGAGVGMAVRGSAGGGRDWDWG